MTPTSMPLDALLGYVSNSDQDTLREVLEHTLQALIEAEAAGVVGVQPHERSEGRLGYRNGHRQRTVDTRVGRLELGIPKLRQGSFLPSLLEPRRRIERALWAVIQEAWVHGMSPARWTTWWRRWVAAVSKSEVSRICSELDKSWRRSGSGRWMSAYPYVWFDATYEKVRQGGRIVSQAVVVAIGVRETGEKCVLGVAVGASETEAFWVEFCRSWWRRGLRGVQLVISDAHEGLRSALAQCFQGAKLAALHGALPAQRGGRLLPPGCPGGAGAGEDGVRPAQPAGGEPGDLPGAGGAGAEVPQGGQVAAGRRAGRPLLPGVSH